MIFNTAKSYKSMFAGVIIEGKLHYVTKISNEGKILEITDVYDESKFANPESEKVSTASWYYTLRMVNLETYPQMRCFKCWNQVNSGKI